MISPPREITWGLAVEKLIALVNRLPRIKISPAVKLRLAISALPKVPTLARVRAPFPAFSVTLRPLFVAASILLKVIAPLELLIAKLAFVPMKIGAEEKSILLPEVANVAKGTALILAVAAE